MSLALTTTHENGIFRGVSGRFLRQQLSLRVYTKCILIHSARAVPVTSSGCGPWRPRFWSGERRRRWRVAGASPHRAGSPRHA